MNAIKKKFTNVLLPAVVLAAAFGAAAKDTQGAETRARKAVSDRPEWTPGSTISNSSWDYDGPVNVIYTAENAPSAPRLEDLPLRDSVSQYGITWTFAKPAPARQFISGDWYVVGPVTVVKITPEPLFGQAVKDHPNWEIINKQAVKEDDYRGKWARNGSVINQPTDTHRGGFDSRLAHGHYDPEQFAHLPIPMAPGDSLISTISATDPLHAYSGHGQPLLTAAVLTCMGAAQPADAFRPSYCDRENRIYLARNLQRRLLYALPRPASAPTNLSEWARLFQRPWLDTVSWGYANPELNSPRYGQRMTNSVSMASPLLHLDYPAIEKERLLVHYVQYGIDLWGIVRAGSEGWQGHGGFGGGRKWTLVFLGILLNDAQMRSPNSTYPKLLFGEDTQTALGESWTGHDVVFTSHPAWTNAETASPELEHPTKWAEIRVDNPNRRGFQSDGYRRCCTSVEWSGEALAAHLMRAEKYWNHDPFFAYVDRWMEGEDIRATAKVVLEAARASGKDWGEWTLRQDRTSTFMQEMWDKYRRNLPPVLGAETPRPQGKK